MPIGQSSVPKSLVFIRAYSYIRVFEEKYSYFARIFVIYSYFCELGHILRVVSCSIQLNHMATILQSWNNQKTCCWILNCIGVLWTCIKKCADLHTFVIKMQQNIHIRNPKLNDSSLCTLLSCNHHTFSLWNVYRTEEHKHQQTVSLNP